MGIHEKAIQKRVEENALKYLKYIDSMIEDPTVDTKTRKEMMFFVLRLALDEKHETTFHRIAFDHTVIWPNFYQKTYDEE